MEPVKIVRKTKTTALEGGHHGYFASMPLGDHASGDWRNRAASVLGSSSVATDLMTSKARVSPDNVVLRKSSTSPSRMSHREEEEEEEEHLGDGEDQVGAELLGSGKATPIEEGESEETSEDSSDSDAGGLRGALPALYEWLMARTTTKQKMTVAILFLFLDAARFFMFEFAVVPTINTMSIFVCADVLSLLLALVVSVIIEGWWACQKIFAWQGLWRFLGISVLFTAALGLNTLAYRTGLSPTVNSMVGKTYLPLSAMVAVFVFKRVYGVLEWLSLSIMMLGIAAFLLLRDRCHINACKQLKLTGTQENFIGMFAVLLSVIASSLASTWAERIYKHRSLHLQAATRGRDVENRYYIYRAQLDIWSTLLLLVGWFLSVGLKPIESNMVREDNYETKSVRDNFFGDWTKRQYFLVLVLVGQKWLAGWMVQYFSTVSKAVASSISVVIVIMVGDAIQDKFLFRDRLIPSMLITTVILLASLIFQTGRINIRNVKDKLAKEAQARRQARLATFQAGDAGRKLAMKAKEASQKVIEKAGAYSVVILYILADTFRSILMYVVQANRYFVPQTMVIMSSCASCMLASVLTYQKEGASGLKRAWQPRKIVKFAVCGLFQAFTSTLMSIAFALGTPSSMVVALGKVYIPLVTIFSFFILGNSFLWLEWFALIILTAASVCFGLLGSLGERHHHAPVVGMLCVVGSATSSCLMSLLMERCTASETDPFIIHKVRLDAGSIFFSALLLPVMGFMGTLPGNPRVDLAFWTKRPGPDYWECYGLAVDHPHNAAKGCDQLTGVFAANATLIGNSTELAEKAANCVCGSGIFLGWGTNYMIYIALVIVVFHGWITGVLVTSFSSVYRAVADGFPIVFIYFLFEPLASRTPLPPFQAAYTHTVAWPPPDWARDAMCLILPLSSTLYSKAADVLKKAVEGTIVRKDSDHSDRYENGEREDESDGEDGSSGAADSDDDEDSKE